MPDPVSQAPAFSTSEEAGVAGAQEASHVASASGSIQSEQPPRIGQVSDLNDLPAVRAYLARQGAKPINFKTATRSEVRDGYPKVVGRIRFDAEGKVAVEGEAEAPTAAEQAAISADFARATIPTPVALDNIADPPPGCNLSDRTTFVCHDFDDRVVMVLQRYDRKDGGKGFLSWTRWSDGEWRNMEPDTLPFFGLPGAKDHATLFIHEGAKAADRVKRLIAGDGDASRFPWYEEMRHGHHIGWLGGVFAVEKSEWGKLAKLGWKRVVIIADNDARGMDAARQIAGKFPANVRIAAFDQRFGEGFDCGDDWPRDLFDGRGWYTGPSLADCSRPATRATRTLPAEGRGRPTVVIRREFAAECAYTVNPPRFMFRQRPSREYTADEFNALVSPFSEVKDTAIKLLGQFDCQHDRLEYHPGREPGTLILDGERCWNAYEPSAILPLPGDTGPWESYLSHLFPDAEEREQAKRWIATLIAKPEVRLRYGLLLISTTQGVGKNTLANVLRAILGGSNVSFPSERAVVESQFNGWIARKRLIFIAEIYSGASRAAYDKMKPVLTDDFVEINEKNVKPYMLRNWATVIACSNSHAALHLDDEDRRWFVPTVAEETRPGDWWDNLYAWLDGDGAGIVLRWAKDYVSKAGHVRTGDRAPGSKRKAAIVEASRSEGQQLAISLAEHLVQLPKPTILKIGDVRRWIARQRGFMRGDQPDLSHRHLESAKTIIAAMRKVDGVRVWADGLRPKFGATREAVVMNFAPEEGQRWPEIKQHLTTLEGIGLNEPF